MAHDAALLALAEQLSRGSISGSEKEKTKLRKAVSAAYYALFHRLTGLASDLLVGVPSQKKAEHAWAIIYRALSHGDALRRCRAVANPPPPLEPFSNHIVEFARIFEALQVSRHRADYDPNAQFSVRAYVSTAKEAIAELERVEKDEQLLFIVFLLFGLRQ
jgi:hypothetical protein